MLCNLVCFFFFFFNDTATTEIYTLSLHDALPISIPRFFTALTASYSFWSLRQASNFSCEKPAWRMRPRRASRDRKSTRLNSSHANISYAVFCLKKKKKIKCNIVNKQEQLILHTRL